MKCDNCGNPIRFPLKDARVARTTSSYQIVVKYYCERCYPQFKTAYDPYNRSERNHAN
jgi:hypothetical protein